MSLCLGLTSHDSEHFHALDRPLNQIIARDRRAIMLCAIEIALDCTQTVEMLNGWKLSSLAAARSVCTSNELLPPPAVFHFGQLYIATTPDINSQLVATIDPIIPAALERTPWTRAQHDTAVAGLKLFTKNAILKHIRGA